MAYEFKIIFFLFVFVLGSKAFEIKVLNAIKKRTYFVSLAPLSSRTQVRFFTLVLNSGGQN